MKKNEPNDRFPQARKPVAEGVFGAYWARGVSLLRGYNA
jgi:hypothetical protein